MLTIADCYDAMRSSRPYRHALGREEAINYLLRGRGTHFEPRLVDLFVAHIEELEAAALSESVDDPECLKEIGATGEQPLPAVHSEAASSVLASISSAHREVLALYELAKVMGRSLSLKDTMQAILDRVVEFLPYTTCVLFLLEEDNDTVRARAAQGELAEGFDGVALRPGEGATGWAIKHHRALFNFDPAMDLDKLPELEGAHYRCASTFPLAVSDRVLGALTFYSDVDNQYTSDHERIMEIVTHQASMALLNAFIYEQTRTSALTDDLTGLPNSRYLDHAFRRRTARDDRPLGVLVTDLDGFKDVNDQHGHAAGDRLLEEVAGLLQQGLRADDVLARVGGDEFVVLASQADGEEAARALIDRLQTTIDNHCFTVRMGQTVRMGLSAGHAFWPSEGLTLDEVMAVADRRMYDDKASRKRQGLRMLEAGRARRASGAATTVEDHSREPAGTPIA